MRIRSLLPFLTCVWMVCVAVVRGDSFSSSGWPSESVSAVASSPSPLSSALSTVLSDSSVPPLIRAPGEDDSTTWVSEEDDDAESDFGPDSSHSLKDEEVFDEEHQKALLRMYGKEVAPETKEEEDPYKYPGMSPDEAPGEWDYAITVDCGSKGSRAHIYKWHHRHSPSSIPPFSPLFTKYAWTSRVSPGISSFVDAPHRVIPHLVQLLSFVKNSLSEFRYKWPRTPIYVKATAGMRLIKNLPSRDRVMETIRTFLSDRKHNPFYFHPAMARVISGEEEGVYGWMTLNYLTGTLRHTHSSESLGALDLGGASTQITFRPPFDVLSNYFPLRMQQETIGLYSHSFLNFGSKIALQRVHARIIELGNETNTQRQQRELEEEDEDVDVDEDDDDQEDDGGRKHKHSKHHSKEAYPDFFMGERDGVRVFRHPCFPKGYSFTYRYVSSLDLRASYTGKSSGSERSKADEWHMSPRAYTTAQSRREMVRFEGGQEMDQCARITWQLLHKRAACFESTCSFNGKYQPRIGNVTFVAFSQFGKVVVSQLKLPRNASLEMIDQKADEICNMTWQQMQDIYPHAKEGQLSKLCFNARYVFTLLRRGFDFPYKEANLWFMPQLRGLDMSWALGATLYEVNNMPWDIDGKRPMISGGGSASATAHTPTGHQQGGDSGSAGSEGGVSAAQMQPSSALASGWLVTLVAFYLTYRHHRREIRRMEQDGMKYESIRDEEQPLVVA